MLFGKIHLQLQDLVDIVWQKQGITFAKQHCPGCSSGDPLTKL
jgi:hypothetical protein